MNCNEFEQGLADAWGDELDPQRRVDFEAHMDACDSCRTKFEGGARALRAMRGLDGPRQVEVRREGDRLVIQAPDAARSSSAASQTRGAYRLAASILIAFTAGYALHAGLMMRDAANAVVPGKVPGLVTIDPSGSTHPPDVDDGRDTRRRGSVTLRSAIASAYDRGAPRSDLAACLAAISRAGS